MERRRERAAAPSPESWSGGKGGHSPHLDTPGSGEGEAPLQVVRPLPEWWGLGYLGGEGVPGSQVCPQCPGGSPGFPGPLPVPWSTWRSPQDAHQGQVRVSRCPGCASGVPTVSSVAMEGVSEVSMVLMGRPHGLQGLQVGFSMVSMLPTKGVPTVSRWVSPS